MKSNEEKKTEFSIKNSIENGKKIVIPEKKELDLHLYKEKNTLDTFLDGFIDGVRNGKGDVYKAIEMRAEILKNSTSFSTHQAETIKDYSIDLSFLPEKLKPAARTLADVVVDIAALNKVIEAGKDNFDHAKQGLISEFAKNIGSKVDGVLKKSGLDEHNTEKIIQGTQLTGYLLSGLNTGAAALMNPKEILTGDATSILKKVASSVAKGLGQGYDGKHVSGGYAQAFENGTKKAYADSRNAMKPFISIAKNVDGEDLEGLKQLIKDRLSNVRHDRAITSIDVMKDQQRQVNKKITKLEQEFTDYISNDMRKEPYREEKVFLDAIGKMQGIVEAEIEKTKEEKEKYQSINETTKHDAHIVKLEKNITSLDDELTGFQKIADKIEKKEPLTKDDGEVIVKRYEKLKEHGTEVTSQLFSKDEGVKICREQIKQQEDQLSAMLVTPAMRIAGLKNAIVESIKKIAEDVGGAIGEAFGKIVKIFQSSNKKDNEPTTAEIEMTDFSNHTKEHKKQQTIDAGLDKNKDNNKDLAKPQDNSLIEKTDTSIEKLKDDPILVSAKEAVTKNNDIAKNVQEKVGNNIKTEQKKESHGR